ncbi:MAG: hypothetical protein B6244_03265 [Candidatus Cloacimonetes bacterium 4572_55]|nr:MAG: hypothetical protein B6244_03265 [Candidatus Cloacimonetes bacterium 4572_55]
MITFRHILIFLAALFYLVSGRAYAQEFQFDPDEIMPLSQVEIGMKGYGKTVFKGTEIERFDIEVVGIIENWTPQQGLIVVRVHHPITDLAQVIHGMSGSPIYINDKIIGALARKFSGFPVDPIAGVTPIEHMLEIKESHERTEQSRLDSGRGRLSGFQDIRKFTDQFWREIRDSEGNPNMDSLLPEPLNSEIFQPFMTPLSITCARPEALGIFTDIFRGFGFLPYFSGSQAVGQISDLKGDVPLEPGSTLGVRLVSGDLSMGGTGTLTYRDDDMILGFGHGMYTEGGVSLPMSVGEVVTVVSDQSYSYKMSNLGEIVGEITQDDFHGILGKIGKKTEMIPTSVNFSMNGDPVRSFNYEVLRDEDLTPFLIYMTTIYSILTTGTLGGERTIEASAVLHLKNYEPIRIEDRFSGQSTEGYTAFLIMEALGLIMGNKFIVPELESVEINLDIVDKEKFAEITHVWYSQSVISPGDDLEVTLFIKPNRGDTFIEKVQISTPNHISEKGMAMVLIGSGNIMDRFEQMTSPARFRPESMEQLIELINKRRTNKNIYVRLMIKDSGAVINGKETPALPPSARRILGSNRVSGSYQQLNAQKLVEMLIPVDYIVAGGQNKIFKITKENTLQ